MSKSKSKSNPNSETPADTFEQQRAVTNYIETAVLGRALVEETVWMIGAPVPNSADVVARDPLGTDHPLPYEETWVAMVDLKPRANFGHDVLVLLIDGEFTQYSSFAAQFPPSVREDGGDGMEIPLPCVPGLTPTNCTTLADPDEGRRLRTLSDDCNNDNLETFWGLYAILISGGWNDAMAFDSFAINLRSVFTILVEDDCDYHASKIAAYYNDGGPLNLNPCKSGGNNVFELNLHEI